VKGEGISCIPVIPSHEDLQIGDLCDKIRSGMTGLGETNASTATKTNKNTTNESIVAQTLGSDHGREKLFLKDKLSRKLDMHTMRDTQPSQSICRSASRLLDTCPGSVYRTKRKTRIQASAKKGTWIRNANRQSYFATMRPPRGAPSAAPGKSKPGC